MIVVPEEMPVTTPVASTEPVDGVPLLHTPPVVASVSGVVSPIHTVPTPVIVPADSAPTVTVTGNEVLSHPAVLYSITV